MMTNMAPDHGESTHKTLVVLTLGTQEVQSDEFSSFAVPQIAQTANVQARELGETLGILDDDELAAHLTDDVLRNGPCFSQLDAETDGYWSLLLLATDQEDPRFRPSDTIELARAIERAFSVRRPKVRVLDPVALTAPPNAWSEALETQIRDAVQRGLDDINPDRVVVLPVGGTPAMRLMAEETVGLLTPSDRIIERLQPDGRGQTIAHSLLQMLDARRVARTLTERVVRTLATGRFRTAEDLVDDMQRLDLPGASDARRVTKLAQSKEREPGTWREQFEVQLSLSRRAFDDDRPSEGLVRWATASELLPAAWVSWRLEDERTDGDIPWLRRSGARCSKREQWPSGVLPPHLQAEERHAAQVSRSLYRSLALCAGLRCETCPLGSMPEASPLLDDDAGARAATWLRHGGGSIIELRNEVVHDGATVAGLDRAVKDDARRLQVAHGIDAGPEPTAPALLTAVFERLFSVLPNDPLQEIESLGERLLTRVDRGHHGPARPTRSR